MAQIHILDSETIDKIAAGEVVERPSSVVKELVENAIDAGAGAVTVEVKDGGISFIRVTDNGCGMEREQLRTAFLRHATSKIENAEDLTHISSLGFRGEALSSIAAVAKVEVITKTSESITGSRMILEGAQETAFEEVGAPEGTTFIVRNLFFNTPVRRKFLRQPATEGGYIADLMEHLALSRPDISFKLVMGNQMKFHTSGNGDLREVIYRIYGREVANALVPIQYTQDEDGIKIEGYLGKPVQVRSNRNFEICFVNGRFIRSNVVSRAVEEGYKEYLMQHKFPLCVLHIHLDTERVDVNVHPTKMDVRFTNAMAFSALLCGAVKYTLKHHEMIPEALLSTEKERKAAEKEERTLRESERAPEPFEQRRGQSYHVMEEAKYKAERPKMQEFIQNPVWSEVKNGENGAKLQEKSAKPQEIPPKATDMSEKTVLSQEEEFFTETREYRDQPEQAEKGMLHQSEQAGKGTLHQPELGEKAADSGNMQQEQSAGENLYGKEDPVQLDLFQEKILTADNRSRFRIIGQVFRTYWLVEFEDKLLMIDQHAAHEKVNYERMMKRFHEKSIVSQALMPAVIVSLSGQEEAVLKEHREVFEGLGFEIEAFGGNEYALRGVPTDLYGCGEKEMFLEVLDQLAGGASMGLRVVEEKIASMSCKAAVKGNNLLSMGEAEALIDELLTLENPYNCPHGRPTIVSMTKTEMERKFKRIVE